MLLASQAVRDMGRYILILHNFQELGPARYLESLFPAELPCNLIQRPSQARQMNLVIFWEARELTDLKSWANVLDSQKVEKNSIYFLLEWIRSKRHVSWVSSAQVTSGNHLFKNLSAVRAVYNVINISRLSIISWCLSAPSLKPQILISQGFSQHLKMFCADLCEMVEIIKYEK